MNHFDEFIKNEVKKNNGHACIELIGETKLMYDFIKKYTNYRISKTYWTIVIKKTYFAVYDTNSNLKYATLRLPKVLLRKVGQIIAKNIKEIAKELRIKYINVVVENWFFQTVSLHLGTVCIFILNIFLINLKKLSKNIFYLFTC